MKTIYFATVLLLCGYAATAQTEKGTRNINGLFGNNGGLRFQSKGYANEFEVNLGVNAGYFIKDNWEIGAGVDLGKYRYKYKVSPDPQDYINFATTNRYGLGLYSKYYFGKKALRPYAVISAKYLFENSKLEDRGIKTERSSSHFAIGTGLGVTWFASKRVALFTQLTYDKAFTNFDNRGRLNLNFGVQITLGKKK